jgi:hypothetical protein
VTKSQIITEIATSKWLPDFCGKVGKHVASDLQQHLLLLLCEMSEEKITNLHQNGTLIFYLVRVGVNAVNGNRYTKFYRDHLRTNETLPDDYDDTAEDYDESNFRRMQEAREAINYKEVALHFNRSDWYVEKLWLLYNENRSMASISKATKINYREISQIINALKAQIKERYNELG